MKPVRLNRNPLTGDPCPCHPPITSRSRRRDLLCAAIILAAVLVIGVPGITTGGFGWSDAPQHTFDGIFVLEFVKQWPIDNPMRWAEQFYFRHPALGIGVYWPPGFAAFEAAMFAAFGVSITTARATVLLFAFGAGLLMASLGRRWFDRPTGLLVALLLITCPHGALWLNDVMLEWPATFWILAAVWAYQKDRDTRRLRWSILLALCVVMAFLTKQTAGFILPVLVLHAILGRDRRAYLLRPALPVSLAIAAPAIVAYVLATHDYSALPPQLLRPSLDVLFYTRRLPEIVGWPMLLLAVLGIGIFIAAHVTSLRGNKDERPGPNARAGSLLLIWFVAWTAFISLIAAKEPRYFFFALPPLCFAAVRFFIRPADRDAPEHAITWKRNIPRLALLAALIITQATLARVRSTGRLPDYAPAVAELAKKPDADLVLVDAVRDGQLIFDLYQKPNTRNKIIPIRASKLLYARAARMKYGARIFVKTEQDIIDLLDRYGIRYIVIESRLPDTPYTDADPLPRKLLRGLLADDSRFTPIGNPRPLRCGDPAWDDVELCLYAYPDCPARASSEVTLSFPGMGRDITFQLP